jgi:hypothetical protein
MACGVRMSVSQDAAMWAISGSFHPTGVDTVSVRVHKVEGETETERERRLDGGVGAATETEERRGACRSWLFRQCPWPRFDATGWTVLPRPCRSFWGSRWWWWVLEVAAARCRVNAPAERFSRRG